ncbi:Acyl-protein synthetase, LuxE [Marinomonas gallaica]|uniref:Acyl-protein synthetase, LuxE n=1 Tax=Marinomonas gallaica TaxID=1806667 RepID=A0A1C3JMJ4_9GAMM|nr:acyl-protein synthetase [Marinomonas gallaica]SBT16341.1 Acyl-protein synthetase, LuxE [Marinomonas gallaica]SBT21389.1 Acyl-protein synthetase, LuxE [Marinomonas gallaica]
MSDWKPLEVFGLAKAEKQAWLLDELNRLTLHHQAHCAPYANLLAGQGQQAGVAESLDAVPFVAARLFKMLCLSSTQPEDVFKTLTSSGTTSQVKSQIVLDRDTAALQSKVLVSLLSSFTGKARRPMLIIDHDGLTGDKAGFSARGAGVQGLSFLGRDHTYALNSDMTPNWPVIDEFIAKYTNAPVLIFGFTFMVWQHFIEPLIASDRSNLLPQALLFHSGGWKKLQDQAVSNEVFKTMVRQALGEGVAVHNFYGMVEQIGSVFVECEQGHLHAPSYADVIIRDQETLEVKNIGESGLIQVLSFIPKSYPGHSILTEDLGRLLGEGDCPCGRKGRYFEVLGRLPKTEVRGCSDVF